MLTDFSFDKKVFDRSFQKKTAKNIWISCGIRLVPFDIKELRDLMSKDELITGGGKTYLLDGAIGRWQLERIAHSQLPFCQ